MRKPKKDKSAYINAYAILGENLYEEVYELGAEDCFQALSASEKIPTSQDGLIYTNYSDGNDPIRDQAFHIAYDSGVASAYDTHRSNQTND